MRLFAPFMAAWLLLATPSSARAQTSHPLPRVVELKLSDGTPLKATYFAATKPGPGVLLFHQSNRTRKSWEDIARELVAVGINALTVVPASSWTDTDQYRGEIRRDAEKILKKLSEKQG